MAHDFDWATAKPPWNHIGMEWAVTVRNLASGDPVTRPRSAELYREDQNRLVGANLKRRRMELGLTQKRVARAAGIHQVIISRVEQTGVPPHVVNKINGILRIFEAKAKR